MPAKYAHYRFGVEMLKAMPPEARRTVNRHRSLYDVGLHGPDLFFYYNPAMHTRIGDLGRKFHQQSGREFFTRVCKRHRLEPSESARAYLYGLLAHYSLDLSCHPLILRECALGKPGHVEIETEFDRYLLVRDGKTPPQYFDCSRHMSLTAGECAVAAGFYPGATPRAIRQCVGNMAAVTRLLAAPEGLPRQVLELGMDTVARSFREYRMDAEPNPACAWLNEKLEERYRRAGALYPVLLRQITANLTCSVPLGREFDPIFG